MKYNRSVLIWTCNLSCGNRYGIRNKTNYDVKPTNVQRIGDNGVGVCVWYISWFLLLCFPLKAIYQSKTEEVGQTKTD